ADLEITNLAGTNLQGAIVRGANFAATNLTPGQLYSTASYQSHDLSRIALLGIDLSNWCLGSQFKWNCGG
ncbi:MAG TPA: pentapeptide repeat-containing protein, partial [Pirellulales bacterium]|nr:pentapeptide repeat-containing protein [Pirellulales bacterium]